MSFFEISSRGGHAATNSTSESVNKNILLSFNMTQDDVLNLDKSVTEAVEARTQELEENRRKKQEQAAALARESNRKRKERWRKSNENNPARTEEIKKGRNLSDRTKYASTRIVPLRLTPEEKKERRAMQQRTRRAAKKKAGDRPKAKKPNAKKVKKNDVSTSTGNTSITTSQPCPVIEEHVLPVSMNPYHEPLSQVEKRKQVNFAARMRYAARKKASEQLASKKPALSRAQVEGKK